MNLQQAKSVNDCRFELETNTNLLVKETQASFQEKLEGLKELSLDSKIKLKNEIADVRKQVDELDFGHTNRKVLFDVASKWKNAYGTLK